MLKIPFFCLKKDFFQNFSFKKIYHWVIDIHQVSQDTSETIPALGTQSNLCLCIVTLCKVILVTAINLGVSTFARLWKLMGDWRPSMISWGPLSLPSIIKFGGALLLNELSYTPQIGRILKSEDNSLKWDQSEVCNFIR